MTKSLFNTLHRLTSTSTANELTKHTPEQLLVWAQGCMLEGLPDQFYEAFIECIQCQTEDGKQRLDISHKFKIAADSEYQNFQPADDLYPAQCIEQALEGKQWSKARLTFSPDNASFSWQE